MGLLSNILRPFSSKTGRSRVGLQFSAESTHIAAICHTRGIRPQLELCRSIDSDPLSRPTVAEIVQYNRLGNSSTSMVLDPQDYQLFPANTPDLPKHEWREAMQWQIQEHIEQPASNMVVEVFDIPPRKSGTEPERIYVVAAQKTAIERLSHNSIRTGLTLEQITIPELSLMALTNKLPEQESGLGLLQLGRKGGLILIIRQQTLYLARSIVNSTSLIAEQNSFSTASQDEVALEIRRTMDFFEGTFDQPPITSIYLLPSSQPLPGAQAALKERLDLPVKEFNIRQLIDVPNHISDSDLIPALPAIGAAMTDNQES
ncbi:MAG: hypothetical protein HQL70_03045 [Magnetococcales bacterium]|nr:hypothetical protein [Magnetococcales bacterium]